MEIIIKLSALLFSFLTLGIAFTNNKSDLGLTITGVSFLLHLLALYLGFSYLWFVATMFSGFNFIMRYFINKK